MLNRRRERRAGIGFDALDHRAKSVRALRREMFLEAELLEQRNRVLIQDRARRLLRIERKQNRDQALHDMRVAIALERERRPAGILAGLGCAIVGLIVLVA